MQTKDPRVNQLFPMNESVRWNPHEKVIGVVGVAPRATADFYQQLISLTPANKEWEHVRVIIDSNPKIPSRGRFFELSETNPSPYIERSIAMLKSMGATIIAVPCNTAHLLYQEYAIDDELNIVHLIKSTVSAAIAACSKVPQAALILASNSVQKYKIYENELNAKGGRALPCDSIQSQISELIEGVKQGKSIPEMKKTMDNLLKEFSNADVIILGCTELPQLLKDHWRGIPVIDCNEVLARECLQQAQNHAFLEKSNLPSS